MELVIWTDGSCSGNPGPGGWAAVAAVINGASDICVAYYANYMLQMGEEKSFEVFECAGGGEIRGLAVISGDEPKTTNNRMELFAIIAGIELIKSPRSVLVKSDSKYAINVLNGKWKATTNLDLVERWIKSSRGFDVTWEHVRGHTGNHVNELCDRIAKGDWSYNNE